ncbi:MAG: SgcJ/EcaC family oxidoreductase [Chitinophagaceae bacterium]|nr:SgcJ/EcaC family oxidoreductase [Chitinophagaceae bacterium]
MKKLFIAAMLLLTTTFSMNVNAQKVSDADSIAIGKTYQQIMMAFARLDAATMANYYTENGTHISPDGQIVSGRAALKEFFEKLFAWFKTLPKPDKTDMKHLNGSARYLSNDLIMTEYTEERTDRFGNKAEKEAFAFSVILKRTNGGWLCELVAMTPVKPMQ